LQLTAAGWIFTLGWIGFRCLGLGYSFEPEQKKKLKYNRERGLRGNSIRDPHDP
jgi:hypothetical protein